MTLKILGIDPGLAATGLGVISGRHSKVHEFAYGVIRTPSKDPLPQRLEKIYTHLGKVLAKERPDAMIVEDVFSLDQYPKSGITLGQVCGVILLAGQQAQVATSQIPVREAKLVLTGNGGADKGQLEKAVRQALGTSDPIRPSHASDALGLALIGLFRYGDCRQKDPRVQRLKR